LLVSLLKELRVSNSIKNYLSIEPRKGQSRSIVLVGSPKILFHEPEGTISDAEMCNLFPSY